MKEHWSTRWEAECEAAALGAVVEWVGRAEALQAEARVTEDGLSYFKAGSERVRTVAQLNDAIRIARRVSEARGWRWQPKSEGTL